MILGLATNLFRLFRENSDVVPVSRLKRQGVRSVTVLDWERVEKLISRAVEDALARLALDLPPDLLKSVNAEAREAFARLVEQRDRWRDSALVLEREKASLEDNLARLRDEIDRSSGQLAVEQARILSADEVAVGPEGMEEFSRRLREELLHLVPAGQDGLADQVTALARRLLDEERRKALELAQDEQRSRLENLERRIAKLKRTLSETEQVVEKLRAAKSIDEGVESIYREVQGLDAADGQAREKRSLLDEVFKLNVQLREAIGQGRTGDAPLGGGPASG